MDDFQSTRDLPKRPRAPGACSWMKLKRKAPDKTRQALEEKSGWVLSNPPDLFRSDLEGLAPAARRN